MQDKPSRPYSSRKRPNTRENVRRASKYAAANRRRRSSTNPTPYIIVGAVAVAAVLTVASALRSSGSASQTPASPAEKCTRDSRCITGGYPSKAEDLYREGRLLLDGAMSSSAGIDQKKLKIAIKKLDQAVAGYRQLRDKHPNEPRIEARINTINKLLYRARKSMSL